MKYFKVFLNKDEYNAFRFSADYVEPHISKIESEDHIHYDDPIYQYSKIPLTFEILEDCFISIRLNGYPISYSKNGGPYIAVENEEYFNLDVSTGDEVSIVGENGIPAGSTYAPDQCMMIGNYDENEQVYTLANFNVKGNIMSLYYGHNFENKFSFPENGRFTWLFAECHGLISSKNLVLPATDLTGTDECYAYMFYNCTSMIDAPVLPATTLNSSCYNGMFYGCSSLKTAPELPAMTVYGGSYSYMFGGCTSLTTAPELPATTIYGRSYYYMFSGCTNLTKAPTILPAMTLYTDCYSSMFAGCTSLTTAPILPATTLANYCYAYMFQNCISLNYIKAMFITYESRGVQGWTRGITSTTGIFVKNSAANWSDKTGEDGVPSGWTIETTSE